MHLGKVTVTSAFLGNEREAEIRRRLAILVDLYGALADKFAVPDFKLNILVTDKFAQDVDRLIRVLATELPPYDPTRGSMAAVARAVPLRHDWRETCLVFDSAVLRAGTELADAISLFLMTHELAHPIMSLVQREIGAIPDQGTALGLSESARHTARLLAEEYRADQLAEIVVRQMVTASSPTAPSVPFGYWDMDGPRFEKAVLDSLGHLPALADEVDEYRNGRAELMATVKSVTSQYDDVLTQLVHLQAAHDASDGDTKGPEILSCAPFDSLREAAIYFGEPWRALIKCIRVTPPLYGVEQANLHDERHATTGGLAIIELWKRFGISFEEFADGSAHIQISEPARPSF